MLWVCTSDLEVVVPTIEVVDVMGFEPSNQKADSAALPCSRPDLTFGGLAIQTASGGAMPAKATTVRAMRS